MWPPWYNRPGWLGVRHQTWTILCWPFVWSPWYNRPGWLGVRHQTWTILCWPFVWPPWYNRPGWLGVRHQTWTILCWPFVWSPWYNRPGWLGVRHQTWTILLAYLSVFRTLSVSSTSDTSCTSTRGYYFCFSWVQFSSRWYVCARKSLYALHPVSQEFPHRWL